MFLFGLVMTLVYGSWTATLDNTAYVQKSLNQYSAAKTCLSRMVDDLACVRVSRPPSYKPPAGSMSEQDPWRFRTGGLSLGDPGFPTLRFASLAHVDLAGTGLTGVTEIIYYVTRESATEESYVLRRRDTPAWDLFGERPVLDPVLCDGVSGLSFTFYDKEDTEHQEWDSESSLFDYATPRAVGIRLELDADPEQDDEAPLVFETRVDLPMVRPPAAGS